MVKPVSTAFWHRISTVRMEREKARIPALTGYLYESDEIRTKCSMRIENKFHDLNSDAKKVENLLPNCSFHSSRISITGTALKT